MAALNHGGNTSENFWAMVNTITQTEYEPLQGETVV
jgi:hypothetical protein